MQLLLQTLIREACFSKKTQGFLQVMQAASLLQCLLLLSSLSNQSQRQTINDTRNNISISKKAQIIALFILL